MNEFARVRLEILRQRGGYVAHVGRVTDPPPEVGEGVGLGLEPGPTELVEKGGDLIGLDPDEEVLVVGDFELGTDEVEEGGLELVVGGLAQGEHLDDYGVGLGWLPEALSDAVAGLRHLAFLEGGVLE